MLCILGMKDGEINGWIIANDMQDARRQAEACGDMELAEYLYRNEFPPPAGKYELDIGNSSSGRYVLLVS